MNNIIEFPDVEEVGESYEDIEKAVNEFTKGINFKRSKKIVVPESYTVKCLKEEISSFIDGLLISERNKDVSLQMVESLIVEVARSCIVVGIHTGIAMCKESVAGK